MSPPSSFNKRKTQLNTSGSHRILDADGAFIGGVVYITGSMTASVGISASLIQGSNASFVVLSASLSGTADGLPYIVAGPNVTTVYNSLGQWEISGSGGGAGNPAGSNTEVQFNNDGAFGASSGLSYYTASFDLYSPGTLVLASSSLSTVSGTNLNNNFTTTQNAFAESLQNYLSGEEIFSGSEPNIQLTASMLVVTSSHILVSRSFIVADGLTVSTSLAAAVGGGVYEEQAEAINNLFRNQVGGLGGFLAQNGARYQLFENNWGLSNLGGDAPLFEVSPFAASQGKPNQGYLTFAGVTQFYSSSIQSGNGDDASFQLTPAITQNQINARLSGTLNIMGEASRLSVISGSDAGADPIFNVNRNEFNTGWGALRSAGTAEFVSGGVYVKEGASLHVQSGSGAAYSAFTVLESATADKVDVLFDKSAFTIAGAEFGGINTRPLYAYMTTGNATPFEMSGNLLAPGVGANSVSKVDLNVIAVQNDSDNYASWLFSVVSVTTTTGITSAIQCSELDTATSGVDAATWDVNVNTDNSIQCTGSAGAAIQWYAQVTKKMSLSGSGLITA